MNQIVGEFSGAALEQARYTVWVPAGVTHILSAKTGKPGTVIDVELVRSHHSLYLSAKRG